MFFGGEFRELNNSLHISSKTNNFLWDGLFVFNTILSAPYFVFGVGKVIDVIFVAEANLTLDLKTLQYIL